MTPRFLLRTLMVIVIMGVALALFDSAAASNGSETDGCVRVKLQAQANTDYRAFRVDISSGSQEAYVACSDQSGFTMNEGSCVTVKAHVYASSQTGAAPPPAATGIYLALFVDNQLNDHGGGGSASWSGTGFIKSVGWTSEASFNASTTSMCATSTGSAGGTAAPGTYRMAIRVCSWTAPTGDGCTGTLRTYDANTDPGSLGGVCTGCVIQEQAQGGMRGDMTPSCFQDSTTQGGADFSTYVGGEARWLRVCDKQAILSTGIESIQMQVIPQAGGAALDSTYASSIRTGDIVDAAFTTGLTFSGSGSYSNNTAPTKRAIIANNSALRAAPWTTFASAPSGVTLTSSTQLDAAWGTVDVGLRVTGNCIVQDPDSAATRPVWIIHHFQTVLSRGCSVQNGRAENLASGTFLRVYRRNANMVAFGGTTDVASCDTTTGSAGAWTCDADTNGNSAATTGRSFVLDIEQFSSSARTTSWAQGTLAGRFDITSINNPGPIGGGDPIKVTATNTNVGDSETLSIQLSFDNGTARTGAAANVSIYVFAPDSTWVVNGAHPIEVTLPDGQAWGFYWYNFTASQEGSYLVLATAKTDLNENRSSSPVTFRVLPYPASQNQVNKTTSYTNGLVNFTQLLVAMNGVRVPIDSSIVLAMDFENDTSLSTTTNDSSPYHNAGTIMNANAWTNYYVAGKDGTGVALDGTNDYVTIPANQSLQLGKLSASVWVKTNGTAGTQVIVSQNPDWSLYQSGTSIIAEVVGCPALTVSSAIVASTWTHVVFTYDLATLSVYVSGALSGTQACTVAIPTTSQNVVFGANASATSTQVWSGSLDKVRLYNRAVTAGEVNALYVGLNPALLTQLGSTANWTASLGNTTSNANSADVKGAIQYGTSEGRNVTGYKVSDKTGFTLAAGSIMSSTFATNALDANAFAQAAADKAWSSSSRTLTGLGTGVITSSTFAANAIDATAFAQGAADKVWSTITRSLTEKTGFSLASGSIATSTFAAGAIDSTVFAQSAADRAWLTTSRSITDKAGFSLAAGSVAASTFASGAIDANAFAQGAADKAWSTTSRSLTDKTGFSLASGSITSATFATNALDANAFAQAAADKVAASNAQGSLNLWNSTVWAPNATMLQHVDWNGNTTAATANDTNAKLTYFEPAQFAVLNGTASQALVLNIQNYVVSTANASGSANANWTAYLANGTMAAYAASGSNWTALLVNSTVLNTASAASNWTSYSVNATVVSTAAAASNWTAFLTNSTAMATAADVKAAVQYGTNVCANSTGCKVSDKTGFSLAPGSIQSTTFAAGAVDSNAFSQTAADKAWASTNRSLTYSIDPTTANIAAAVWDVNTNAHTQSGSFGGTVAASLNAQSSVPGMVDENIRLALDESIAQTRAELDVQLADKLAPIQRHVEHLDAAVGRQSKIVTFIEKAGQVAAARPAAIAGWRAAGVGLVVSFKPGGLVDVAALATAALLFGVGVIIAPRGFVRRVVRRGKPRPVGLPMLWRSRVLKVLSLALVLAYLAIPL